MSYLGHDQAAVDREAEAFVKDFLRGGDKDKVAARRLLLGRVNGRHDPRSKAIRRILEDRGVKEKKRPRLGVAVMVKRDKALLLGQSKKISGRGRWVVPGGGLRFGETIAECGAREILEETGLVVEIRERFGAEGSNDYTSYDTAFPKELISDGEHRVILFVEGHLVGGDLKAGDDLEDVGFFTREQLSGAGAADLTDLTATVLQETGWLG